MGFLKIAIAMGEKFVSFLYGVHIPLKVGNMMV